MVTELSADGCRILVLGPAAIRSGNDLHPLRGQQGEVLCALAARYPDPVPADQLIDLLWPDGAPRTARTGLGVVIHRLRERWDDTDFIVNEAGCYRLIVPVERIDAVWFAAAVRDALSGQLRPAESARSLSAALAVWRGDAFQPFDHLDILGGRAGQLQELRRDAEEGLVDSLLAAGEADDAAMLASQHVESEPYRERRWQQLMLALYRTGRQAEALRTGQRAGKLLRDELGIEPGPALRALESDILAQAPSLDGPTTPTVNVAQFVASLGQLPSNIPIATSTFIGRADELSLVGERLAAHASLTIVGPAGSGKTRLALEYARGAADRRVVWLDLVPLDADRLVGEIAERLGIRASADDPTEAIARALGTTKTLVVFDNCEHLAAAVGAISSALLRAVPNLEIVATSRVPLGSATESLMEVPPLTPAQSAQLLAERAFGDAKQGSDVSAVVDLLGGVPLFLELVAPSLATLTPTQLAAELRTSLANVQGDGRADERHRGLASALAWSVDLLDEPTARTYEALGIMEGAFGIEGVAAIVERSIDEVRSHLHTLARHYLIETDRTTADPLFRIPVATRAHARQLLTKRGVADQTRRRHAHYFAGLVAERSRQLMGPDESVAERRLARSLEQLVATQQYLVSHPDEVDRAAQFCVDLFDFSFMRQHYSHYHWPEQALAMPGIETTPSYVSLLAAGALMAWARDDLNRAGQLAERATALATQRGDQPPLLALRTLLNISAYAGQQSAAVTALIALIGESERQGDERELAVTLVTLVLGQSHAGMHTEAKAAAARSMEISESLGNPSCLAWSHFAVGSAVMIDDPNEALRQFTTSIRLARQVNNRFVEQMALGSLASGLRRLGRNEQAADILADVITFWGRANAHAQVGFLARDVVLLLCATGDRRGAAAALCLADRFDRTPPLMGDDLARYEELSPVLRSEFGLLDLDPTDDVAGQLADLLVGR